MELNGIHIKYVIGIVLLVIFLIYYVTILWAKIDVLKNKLSKYEKGERSLILDDLKDEAPKETMKNKKKKLPEPKFEDI